MRALKHGSSFPASYPGGKNGAGVYQRIISLMPPHEVYIEPFLGSGAIMARKRPALANIGIDLDPAALDLTHSKITELDDGGRRYRFLQKDGIDFLADFQFTGPTLVYCDPPYLMSTRSQRRPIYRHEMSDDDHRRLLDVLKAIDDKCMILVSGYWSELYAAKLRWMRWGCTSYQSMTRGGSLATEWLWYNYPQPVELHDYRYLGTDFRERERIKRKKARWTARLRSLPILERQALLGAIEETRQAPPPNATVPADAGGNSEPAGPLA